MAPSMDFVISGLFCAEYKNAILENVYDDVRTLFHENHQNSQQTLCLTAVPFQSDDCVAIMIKKECEYVPCADYLEMLKNGEFDVGSREQILDWICKVHSQFKFGPLCLYLSVNYLDRFLSVFELPEEKEWTMQLLGIACVSIAAKMEEIEVPLSIDLQIEETQFVFEESTIQRMELVVLKTLNWRMHAVTPFSYIDYFLKKINGEQIVSRSSMLKATNLIIGTLKGIHFLEFKPSEIAAAVAIYVVKNETGGIEKPTFALLQQVQEDKVKKCVELITESSLLSDFGASTLVVPPSPTGVWDVASSSDMSDDDDSSPIFPDDEPATKRRIDEMIG
ncbi:cyclin-D4-2-like [Solanum dulcamara]|uniref:cyclin-D4-2-like n=1 Tax=Solanum dulcamara TaxID=45834 RepID=UPI002485DF97|nr:cyclin-D4-2-like [Solanum dulcamara]